MESWSNPDFVSRLIWGGAGILLFFIVATFWLVRISLRRVKKEVEARANLRVQAQKDLLENTLLTQEKERQRIAADLHDNLVSELNLIRMKSLNGADEVSKDIGKAMTTARRISHDLSPPMISMLGFGALVQDYVQAHQRFVPARFELFGEDQTLQEDSTLQVFRVFQETFSNAIKHADASRIDVKVRFSESGMTLRVADDGRGMDGKEQNGLGHLSVASRAQYLKAQYKWITGDQKGTTFLLCINKSNYGRAN